MVRSIVSLARVRPASRRGPLDILGPDEDGFTLVVAAAEATSGGGAFEHLDVVGGGGELDDWALREALGAPTLQLRHHRGGPASLFSSLAESARIDGTGASLVVAIDPASETGGTGAVAFRLEEGPGVALLGHRERGHPEWRRPEAAEWTEAGRRALGTSNPPSEGTLFLSAPTPPPVLLQRWAKEMPGFPVVHEPPAGTELGDSATLRAALAVRSAFRTLKPGGSAVVALLEPGRATGFLGLRADRPVDDREAGGRAREAPDRPAPPPDVRAVSEGAYLPRPTYLQSLPSRWRFVADRCGSCSKVTFPQRQRCRGCGAVERLEPVALPRSGLKVLARTTVAPGAQPTEFDPAVEVGGAYDVVIAELADGVRVTLQVTDAAARSVEVGDLLDSSLRRTYAMEGEWRYGRKAIPRTKGSA